MPIQGKEAQNKVFEMFSHAKKEIKIVIYSFTNSKLAKALKIAAKKGVNITVIADKEEAKYRYSVIPNLACIKNIHVFLLSGKKYKNGENAKMHVKLAIIDNRYLITGSANYSYSAFFKNYEYIQISSDKKSIKKFNAFFNIMKKSAKKYRLSR
jgi:phosphatidylserine/phosphatidylglycerophosphate/cardiolipin synthase-like enzyme